MSLVKTDTNNGSFNVVKGRYAAEKVLDSLAKYTNWVNGDFRDYYEGIGSKSSKGDKVGAGAGVVGAIAGIAGLAKSSSDDSDTLDIEIINYSNHVIVPQVFRSQRCCLKESPRPITISDHSLIRCSWSSGFETGESQIQTQFLVNSPTGITKVSFYWELQDVFGAMWLVDKVMVDDGTQENLRKADTVEELFCVSFDSNDEIGNPSFKAFFHSVRSKSAKTFIAFTPA